jgi:signal transduction histidine kinase
MSQHRELRLLLLALAAGLPAVVLALVLTWTSDLAPAWQWTWTALLIVVWLGGVFVLGRHTERALRARERQVWEQLIRVLSHEINNSLASVQSITELLLDSLEEPLPDDWKEEFSRGLGTVRRRAAGLARFMASYARLTRLPTPQPSEFEVRPWLERVVRLETRIPVDLAGGPEVEIEADQDQLEQVIINLLRNAADAALETQGGVRLGWRDRHDEIEIWIEDDGPGLPAAKDLFLPSFTTKESGSGIGLALSREIVEAHGGQLVLEDRIDPAGCRATMRLPARRRASA